MNKEWRQRIRRFIFSFPVQLLAVQFKKNHVQLLYWLLLFLFVCQGLMVHNGVPFLFLDPEHMGRVSIGAFFIVGICTALFWMAYNISSFLLNSHRFPFLASLSRTFFKYSLNNFIVPLSFVITYLAVIAHYQYYYQLQSIGNIAWYLVAMVGGVVSVLCLTFWYFNFTDKNIYKLYGINPAAEDDDDIIPVSKIFTRKKIVEQLRHKPWVVFVETYLASFTQLKLVRDTSHYDNDKLQAALRKNHYHAAVFQSTVLVLFISLGYLRDIEFFQVPAAASIFLLFTLAIMLSGLLTYWLGAWVNFAVIALLLVANWISGFDIFSQRNQAYGMNYGITHCPYSLASVDSAITPSRLDSSYQNTIGILDRWKQKNTNDTLQKPKLVLLNVSGGGVRSMLFTFHTLRNIDSVLQGKFMDKVFLISGSSGGMIGAAYYRQLFMLHQQNNLPLPFATNAHISNAGKDMLNATAFSLIVNDLFFTLQKYDDGQYSYIKDRAYAWEQQLHRNTQDILRHRLSYYKQPEYMAQIPLMVMSPTIVNDGRVLYICTQPVSYLMQHGSLPGTHTSMVTNGIDYAQFFSRYNPYNMQFSSALRMNATFPYIMPPVSMPSLPPMECMDSGIRDNFGIHTSMRFAHAMQQWITQNTSGVVIVQIRDTYKQASLRDNSTKSMIQNLFTPLRNVSNNLIIMQDYQNDAYLQQILTDYPQKVEILTFEMPDNKTKIPLSWHLSHNDKIYIQAQARNAANSQTLLHLTQLLK